MKLIKIKFRQGLFLNKKIKSAELQINSSSFNFQSVMFTRLFVGLTLLFLCFLPATVQAQTKTFTGTGNFSDASKWTGGTLPTAGQNLVIDGTCIVDNNGGTDNVAFGTLTIGTATGRTLSWASGGTNRLNVSNVSAGAGASTLNMTNGGTLIIRGTWVSTNLSFTPGAGTIELKSTITLPAAYTTYNNLTVNGSGKVVTMGIGTTINNNLTLTAGVFSAGAFSLAVTGTTSIAGTMSITSATGAKSFGDLLISSGGVFTNTTTVVPVTIAGNFQNDGTFDQGTGRVTFTGATSNTISGTAATTAFGGGITVNKGTANTNILDVQSVITMSTGGLTLTNGTFKLTGASTITPFSADIPATPYLIPSTAGLWCNGGTISPSAMHWSVDGLLRVTSGLLSIGTASSHILGPKPNSLIWIEGGNLTTTGRISNPANPWTFNMTGGTITINTMGTSTANRPPFNMDVTSCSFSMSGGTMIIERAGGSAGQNLGFYCLATSGSGFTGGTLQLGNSSTPAASTIGITSTNAIYNLTLNSASVTAQLQTNTLSVTNMITISAGTLSANNLNLSIGGNWIHNGTFIPGTATVTFNGATTLSGNAATFNDIVITGTLSPSVDLALSGDFINNGSFVAANQLVTLSGSSAQQIGGSSLTAFKNLTLNNSAGSYLSASESITGELNITSGTFSTTGYNFTLVSDANGTARIAPILGNFSGNITMQQFLNSGPTDWRFLASPVSGVTINDWQDNFVTSGFPGSTYPNFTFPSIYTYDETIGGTSDNGYNSATNATDPITPGRGYWCYIGPGPLTIDVTGPPATFNQTFQVSYTASGGTPEDGWMMIGNPYPSPIDWSSANWTKTNINDAIYIWNPVAQQYASWVSGTSTNGGSNLIASSQSFWIQANATNPSLSCTENIKVSSSTPFIKPPAPAVFDKLKLNIEGNNYKDETFLQFGSGATNGYDGDADARKLFSSNPQVPGIATSDFTQKDMSINSLPPIDSTIHIPVKTIVGQSGNYSINVDSSSTMSSDFCIILEDLVTGIKTNLNNSATYSFLISDTTQAARFILHISAPHHTESVDANCNQYQDGKAIAVAKGTGPWDYLWFNSVNNNIKQTLNTFSADTLNNLGAGDYSVQISNPGGMCGSFIKKITVAEPLPVYAGFTYISGTISAGSSDSLVLQNTSSGALSYKWNFGDGSPIDNSYTPSAHHYDSTGLYIVTLVAKYNTCTDSFTQKLVVLPPNLVGINENRLENRITVYPNPGNGLFYLTVNEIPLVGSWLEVFMASGETISKFPLTSEKTEIDLTLFSGGIYFYRIVSQGKKAFYGKLVKE